MVASKTRELLAATSPDTVILDGGPARNKALDREAFERLERLMGGTGGLRRLAKMNGSGAATFMEAEWVATDSALLYVHFNAGSQTEWSWEDIVEIGVCGSTLLGKRVGWRTRRGGQYELSMSRRGAQSLVDIASSKLQMGGKKSMGDISRRPQSTRPPSSRRFAIDALRWVVAGMTGLLGVGLLAQSGDAVGGSANFLFGVVLVWLAVVKIRPRRRPTTSPRGGVRLLRMVLGVGLIVCGAVLVGEPFVRSLSGEAALEEILGGIAFGFLGIVTLPRRTPHVAPSP